MRKWALAALAATTMSHFAAQADTLIDVAQEHIDKDVPMPVFKADTSWPKLPDDLILGQIPGLSIAEDDTIWILTRPNSLGATETGRSTNPPITAACCKLPPHVMQFDQDGNLLRHAVQERHN